MKSPVEGLIDELYPGRGLTPEGLAAGLNSLGIKRELIAQAEAKEDEAAELRLAVDAIDIPTIEAAHHQHLRLTSQHPNGIHVQAIEKVVMEETEHQAFIWLAVPNPQTPEYGIHIEPDGTVAFYGKSAELDDRTQQLFVYNDDYSLRALYREEFEQITLPSEQPDANAP